MKKDILLTIVVVAMFYMIFVAMFGELGYVFGTIFNIAWMLIGKVGDVCLKKITKNC